MDNLDDMSTGRVTRSLRKRLTSVDSIDTGSRPSTPQLAKLTSITEQNSPSRTLRATRRNSTTGSATPTYTPARSRATTIAEAHDVPSTPSKRTPHLFTASVADSQFSQVSEEPNEDNENRIPTKRMTRLESKSSPLRGPPKKSKPVTKNRRSKALNDCDNRDSDIEVINLEDQNSDNEDVIATVEKRRTAKSHTIKERPGEIENIYLSENTTVISESSTIEDVLHQKEDVMNLKSSHNVTPPTHTNKQLMKSEVSEVEKVKMSPERTPQTIPTATDKKGIDIATLKSSPSPAVTSGTSEAKEQTPSKNSSIQLIELSDDDNDKDNINKGKASCTKSVVKLEKLSPNIIAKLCGKSTSVNSPMNSKSVTFDGPGHDDEVLKNTYPKTPLLIKRKSCVSMDFSNVSEDKSFQSEKESVTGFEDANICIENMENDVIVDQCNSEIDANHSSEYQVAGNDEENNFEVAVEVKQVDTPYKSQLSAKLQSSTPIMERVTTFKQKSAEDTEHVEEPPTIPLPETSSITSTKRSLNGTAVKSPIEDINKCNLSDDRSNHEIVKKDEPIATIHQNTFSGDKSVSSTGVDPVNTSHDGQAANIPFSKSWSHNVSGRARSCGKIDIISAASPSNNEREVSSVSAKSHETPRGSPGLTQTTRSDIENDVQVEEDGEGISSQKLDFVDDEAVEAPDFYQSGDSMDAEERKAMEDNEIVDEGKSLGSEDTSNDEDNAEESSEGNDSFITSDSDDSQRNFSTDNENSNELVTKKSKRNFRILVTSESEVEEPPLAATQCNKTKGDSKNSCNKSNTSHNFEISRMIDETTDEDESSEVTASKTSTKPQNSNVIEEMKTVDPSDKIAGNRSSKSYNENGNNDKDNSKVGPKNCEHQIADVVKSSLFSVNNELAEMECGDKTGSHDNASSIDRATDIQNTKNTSKLIETRVSLSSDVKQKADNNDRNSVINVKEDLGLKAADVCELQANTFADSKTKNYSDCFNENENFDKELDDDIEIPETQEREKVSSEADSSDETTMKDSPKNRGESSPKMSVNDGEVIEENIEYILNNASESRNAGLSVSLSQVKRDKVKRRDNMYSSFTIGVTVLKNEDDALRQRSSSSDSSGESGSNQKKSENSSKKMAYEVNQEEEKVLDKLRHPNKKNVAANKKRHSLAVLNAEYTEDIVIGKKSKRRSMQSISSGSFNPSKSLIEDIEDRKRELHVKNLTVKTRLSKSFCGTVESDSNNVGEGGAPDDSDYDVENRKKTANVLNSAIPINTDIVKHKTKDTQDILAHCDEILEAANRAKLEAKQNYKKSTVIIPKKNKGSSYTCKTKSEEQCVQTAPIVKKDMKQSKEKTKLALEQALKASAKILMSDVGKKKQEKLVLQTNDDKLAGKRLPKQLLDMISNTEPRTEKRKIDEKGNELESQSPVKRMNCATGEIIEEAITPPVKRRCINKFHLPTGTVLEEPITVEKGKNIGGFRESPVTPRIVGCKVRRILTAGQDEPPVFISKRSARKRKVKIDEPKNVLPKPQWSQSGVFLEEEVLPKLHSSLHTRSTEFSFSSLNDKQRHECKGGNSTQTVGVSTATQNALRFKKSVSLRKTQPRESSHEVLMRKERKQARNYY